MGGTIAVNSRRLSWSVLRAERHLARGNSEAGFRNGSKSFRFNQLTHKTA
jgi:hypothetical protein